MSARLVRVSMPLSLLGLAWLPAVSAAAQDGPRYPAVDVSLALPAEDSAAVSASGDDRAVAGVAEHDLDAPAGGAANGAHFDASHFTPSANPDVRDVDGDGHLDGLVLLDGVGLWRGLGDGRLDAGVLFPTGVTSFDPVGGEWGDVNDDGRLDAIFLAGDAVQVFVDEGDGSFSSNGVFDVNGVNNFQQHIWVTADMNGDGFADLVGLSQPPAISRVEIVYGTGTPGHGWFGSPVTLTTTTSDNIWELGAGDLDGNGLPDVAYASNAGLNVWTQDSPGNFSQKPPLPLPYVHVDRIEIRDMSGDALPDLIVHVYNELLLFEGDGTGNPPAPPVQFPQLDGLCHFVDVDGDGLVDVMHRATVNPKGPEVVLAHGDGTLSEPVSTLHTAQPLALGDFDEDGTLDLWSREVLLRGLGDGHFAGARNFPIGVDVDSYRQITVADFNEDGSLDVVAVTNAIGIFGAMSDVGASWHPPSDVFPTMDSTCIASGDLDGDGHLDVLAGRMFVGQADYCLGDGDGGFQTFPPLSAIVFGGGEKSSVGIGQFDAGAPVDVVACGDDGLIRARLGQGALAFGAVRLTSLAPGFGGAPSLLVDDLDDDGFDDLIVSQFSGTYSFRSLGNALFAGPVLLDSGPYSIPTLADVDDDGDEDLLLGANDILGGVYEVRTLLGDGDGHFAPAPFEVVESVERVRAVAATDVDGDGQVDLAVGHDRSWSLFLGAAGGGWDAEPVSGFDLPGTGHMLRFVDPNLDGLPDLLSIGGDDADWDDDDVGLTLFLQRGGPWQDLGFGLAGDGGLPFLFPQGSLQPSTPFGLVLRDGAPGAAAWFIFGLSELSLPFKGGVLVPNPLLVLPAPPISGQGVSSLAATWPSGVPSGIQLWLQCWIADASGPAGFTASNAVVGTTP